MVPGRVFLDGKDKKIKTAMPIMKPSKRNFFASSFTVTRRPLEALLILNSDKVHID